MSAAACICRDELPEAADGACAVHGLDRLLADLRPVYRYAWGNNDRRAALQGRRCVVLARGGKNTVLVRFLDTGERVTTSRRALRREEPSDRHTGATASGDRSSHQPPSRDGVPLSEPKGSGQGSEPGRGMDSSGAVGRNTQVAASSEPCPECGCPGEEYDGHVCEDFAGAVRQ